MCGTDSSWNWSSAELGRTRISRSPVVHRSEDQFKRLAVLQCFQTESEDQHAGPTSDGGLNHRWMFSELFEGSEDLKCGWLFLFLSPEYWNQLKTQTCVVTSDPGSFFRLLTRSANEAALSRSAPQPWSLWYRSKTSCGERPALIWGQLLRTCSVRMHLYIQEVVQDVFWNVVLICLQQQPGVCGFTHLLTCHTKTHLSSNEPSNQQLCPLCQLLKAF